MLSRPRSFILELNDDSQEGQGPGLITKHSCRGESLSVRQFAKIEITNNTRP
jgi:hypothetical protein